MNQTSSSDTHGSFEWTWNSSVSFLYGGLAPIFVVIGIALLIVACSRRLRSETDSPMPSSETDSPNNIRLRVRDDIKPKGETSTTEVDHEPNILVIVAGEYHPTHLAKPLSFTTQP